MEEGFWDQYGDVVGAVITLAITFLIAYLVDRFVLARAARAADLSAGQAQAVGAQRAQQFAGQVGGKAVTGTSVAVDRSEVQVRVEVTGTALAIVPAFTLTVRGQAVSPVERFVPAGAPGAAP